MKTGFRAGVPHVSQMFITQLDVGISQVTGIRTLHNAPHYYVIIGAKSKSVTT